jgi:hypothetical protein
LPRQTKKPPQSCRHSHAAGLIARAEVAVAGRRRDDRRQQSSTSGRPQAMWPPVRLYGNETSDEGGNSDLGDGLMKWRFGHEFCLIPVIKAVGFETKW